MPMMTTGDMPVAGILPHDASLHGHRVDAALQTLAASTGAVFTVMALFLLVAVVFHRGRNRRAHYTHGNRGRDRLVAVVAGAVVLFGIDAVAVVNSSADLRAGFWGPPEQEAAGRTDPRRVRVEVTAQQWAWSFRYPGPDDTFNTADDVVTLNDLRVPVNHPVSLQLTSKDVVHSFYLPNFRTKLDAIPGTVTRLGFEARETGVFEIGCAQHCGAWHYKMRGELTVTDDAVHEAWLRRASAEAALRRRAAAEAHQGDGETGGWTWKSAP